MYITKMLRSLSIHYLGQTLDHGFFNLQNELKLAMEGSDALQES